jgi:hypothetical protein
MTATLYRNNDPDVGSRTPLADVSSPTADVAYSSVGFNSSSPITVINNAGYNYQVDVLWSTGSADLRLMAVRITYVHPD